MSIIFREVRNQYTQSVRKAKASFFRQKFASCSSFTQIQIADVLKELQNLDPYKSAGLDNLDPLFLKLSAAIVATPITSLFNLSFISSEIPKDWKAAAVIPLFKGGDTLDPNCYRPISISAVQSGFRAGHGCTSATLKVLNDIITAIDKRQYCAAVFIDLAQAFNSVNHHILIRSEEHTSELQSL